MSLNKLRQALYKINVALGDIQAIKKGRVKERLWNRIIGKISSKVTSKFYK